MRPGHHTLSRMQAPYECEYRTRARSSPHPIAGERIVGFKRLRNAAVTISAIELMHRIRKGQFDLTAAHLKDTSAPSIWMTVLSAR